jgi:hypothetical protein
MISYCRMEPGHPEWREFRRRMDQAFSSMQCGAGPHDEAADKAKLDAIMNAPNFEEAIQIADTTVCDLFKVTRVVLREMGLSEGAIAATLENFDDLGGGCDCKAPAELEGTYDIGRSIDAHRSRN